MALHLRALVNLPHDQGSIPSTCMGSQPSVTSVPGDPVPSSGLHECQACICYTDIYVRQNIYNITFKTKQKTRTGVIIESGMLQGFHKKAGVRHAVVSGQMSVWQMGAIIQTAAIGEAIVGHRHMDAWSLLGLLGVFFLHG